MCRSTRNQDCGYSPSYLDYLYAVYNYLVTVTADAHEKVIWFDVSVDEVLCVYILNSADHLKMKRSHG